MFAQASCGVLSDRQFKHLFQKFLTPFLPSERFPGWQFCWTIKNNINTLHHLSDFYKEELFVPRVQRKDVLAAKAQEKDTYGIKTVANTLPQPIRMPVILIQSIFLVQDFIHSFSENGSSIYTLIL